MQARMAAHQLLLKEREPVHALERIRRGCHVCKDQPRLPSQLIRFAALNISDPAKLRKKAVQTLL